MSFHAWTGMTDRISSERRSRNMALIRSRDTAPELTVRRALHRLGYRYRLHVKSLPGKPDVVFSAKRRVLLVHGCFWHRHSGCRRAFIPESRKEFWAGKFASNVRRDLRILRELESLGWRVLIIWECETRSTKLRRQLTRFLGPPNSSRKETPCAEE
jgi:DNA mismatch endonuclease, patch repair protein